MGPCSLLLNHLPCSPKWDLFVSRLPDSEDPGVEVGLVFTVWELNPGLQHPLGPSSSLEKWVAAPLRFTDVPSEPREVRVPSHAHAGMAGPGLKF